jgi:hypothetical protein
MKIELKEIKIKDLFNGYIDKAEDGVIGSGAFRNCTNLATITVPSSVTEIGYQAFQNTPWLAAQQTSSENGLVIVNNILTDGTSATGNITIPSTVTTIGYEAFGGCTTVTGITFEADSQLTSIGEKAFIKCNKITYITLPLGVTNIGEGAFNGCTFLKTVNYRGTEEQWNEITIDTFNDPLTNATKNYNYTE